MRSQHFEALVAGLRRTRPDDRGGPGEQQWLKDVEVIGEVYDKMFPRFSRVKFLRALGVETAERPRGVRTRVLKQLLMTQEKMAHKIEELEHLLAGARQGGQHDGL